MSGDINTLETDKSVDMKSIDIIMASLHSRLECLGLKEIKTLLIEIVNSIDKSEIENLKELLFQQNVITLKQMNEMEDDNIKKNVSDLMQGIKSQTDKLPKVFIEFLLKIDKGYMVEEILAKHKAQEASDNIEESNNQEPSQAEFNSDTKNDSASSQSELNIDKKNVPITTEKDAASSQPASVNIEESKKQEHTQSELSSDKNNDSASSQLELNSDKKNVDNTQQNDFASSQPELNSDKKNFENTKENDSASSQVAPDDQTITNKEESAESNSIYAWFVKDLSLKEMHVTQSDASKFSTCFGVNWQSNMIEFGFTKNNIDLARENDGYNPQRTITSLIIRWIQSNGKNATMDKFLTILKDTEDDSIDWKKLEQIVRNKK